MPEPTPTLSAADRKAGAATWNLGQWLEFHGKAFSIMDSQRDRIDEQAATIAARDAEIANLDALWKDALARLLNKTDELEHVRAEIARLREALESMAWQHAYRTVVGGVPHLSTGGLSANEEAFEVLEWADPKPCPGNECDVEGCPEWNSSGLRWEGFYARVCHDHATAVFKGQPRPPMRPSAIAREALRVDGVLPVNWEVAAVLGDEGGRE